MSIEITDYIDVEQRSSDLGLKAPEGACILPRHFADAKNVADLSHESAALDLKALFRAAEVPVTVYQPDGTKIPYLQENDITWVGPVLFFTAASMIENPLLVNIAIKVIADYVSNLFKGSPQAARVKLSVVVEKSQSKTTTKTTKKLDFDGPPDKLNEISNLIKDFE